MSREVRRVPKDWKHPMGDRGGPKRLSKLLGVAARAIEAEKKEREARTT